MFDENCCKASKTFHVVKKGEEGKLCGTVSSLNPFSSCKGPKLKDDIEVGLGFNIEQEESFSLYNLMAVLRKEGLKYGAHYTVK